MRYSIHSSSASSLVRPTEARAPRRSRPWPALPGTFAAATIYTASGANEIAVADVNGDGKPDIIVSNGVTNPLVNGVATTHPGVLLQNATSPGTFGALEDLP